MAASNSENERMIGDEGVMGGEEEEEEKGGGGKRKRMRKYHQTRAHANPLSDQRFPWCPLSPQDMNWNSHYPAHFGPDSSSLTGFLFFLVVAFFQKKIFLVIFLPTLKLNELFISLSQKEKKLRLLMLAVVTVV